MVLAVLGQRRPRSPRWLMREELFSVAHVRGVVPRLFLVHAKPRRSRDPASVSHMDGSGCSLSLLDLTAVPLSHRFVTGGPYHGGHTHYIIVGNEPLQFVVFNLSFNLRITLNS